ncbi:MAG: sensor histidine kinase [Pacificimonas sp.]
MSPLSRRFLSLLTLALLPIGIIAIYLSIQSFETAEERAQDAIVQRASTFTNEIDNVVADHGLVLRALALQGRGGEGADARRVCDAGLTKFVNMEPLYGSLYRTDLAGEVICQSEQGPRLSSGDSARVLEIAADDSGVGSALFFDEEREHLIFAVRTARGQLVDAMGAEDSAGDNMVAIIPIDALRGELAGVVKPQDSRFSLSVANSSEIAAELAGPGFADDGSYRVPTATSVPGLSVNYLEPIPPLDARALIGILTPPVMWLAALLISWLALRRLVTRPLARMRRTLEDASSAEEPMPLVTDAGGSEELYAFADAYDGMASAQAAARRDLEKSLGAQERLIREVHHRVKNNLQIITSLLSIKARDTDDAKLERAYGTIQMRVSALANVHRWLHADNVLKGVDLSSLLTDLCAGLEGAVANVEGVRSSIRVSCERMFISQDGAIPLSFLLTEIIAGAAARLHGSVDMQVDLNVTSDDETNARAMLASAAFVGENPFATGETVAEARIVQGMIRQLRGTIIHDAKTGTYRIEFPVQEERL